MEHSRLSTAFFSTMLHERDMDQLNRSLEDRTENNVSHDNSKQEQCVIQLSEEKN